MAEATEFTHDQLGHILADHLVEVPSFQRSYSWERLNTQEYLSDLQRARENDLAYFMGTLVFARASESVGRRKIVDGQQRLATTAILFVAIRDKLVEFDRHELAQSTASRYLTRFSIQEESHVDSIILNPEDRDSYDALIAGRSKTLQPTDKIRACYEECYNHLSTLAEDATQYRELIAVIEQLDKSVQVLVAVATDLPEAYVIFETLNDRGADLTIADLLKNFLFSQARASDFSYVEVGWRAIETQLGNKPDELVKFVRFEFISHYGRITTRKLYRALQDDVGSMGSKSYVQRLKLAVIPYTALRDADNEYWNDTGVVVRDALVAYRRFGFESNYPVLLAAFREWDKVKAAKLMLKLVNWSVRAQFAGQLGTGAAEEAFPAAAKAIADGIANNQSEVRTRLDKLIPDDDEFKKQFVAAGKISANRAKYILAMLDRAFARRNNKAEPPLDWASTGVTIEHILPVSATGALAESKSQDIGNLTLLEKRLNHQLGSKPHHLKCAAYKGSAFLLTNQIGQENASVWGPEEIDSRTANLAELACLAFPIQ